MKIIYVCLIVSIIFAFFSVWVLNNFSIYPLEINTQFEKFYINDFSKQKNIFLIGSSYVGALNADYINEKMKNNDEFTVYNIALSADKPSRRILHIDDLISTKPDLIIYGIGLRELTSFNTIQQSHSILPDPKLSLYNLLSIAFNDLGEQFKNSKFILFKNIYTIINPDSQILENGGLYSPFFNNSRFNSIHTYEELEKSPGTILGSSYFPLPNSNYEYSKLKEILQKLYDADIQVVIFTVPYHPILWNSIDEINKQNFDLVLSDLSESFEIDIYRLDNEYSNLKIWNTVDHVSSSKISSEYNNDIIQIINERIK